MLLQNVSIRHRLVVWYLLSITLIVAGMGIVSWWTMRASIYGILDDNLKKRAYNTELALHAEDPQKISQVRQILTDNSKELSGGGSYWVSDPTRVVIYRLEDATQHDIDPMEPPALAVKPGTMSIQNAQTAKGSARLGARMVDLDGKNWIIEWIEPLKGAESSLHSFSHMLLLSTPLLIGLGVLLSYLISRQALAPVDLIIKDARSINFGNLSERLSVPKARDELRRLSETLNSMLARIESSKLHIQQFTADASHELRSPISVIRAATGYCLNRERTREDLLEALVRIDREAEDTARLIDDLLLLARFDANTDTNEIASIDFSDATRDALGRIAPIAKSKPVTIHSQIPSRPIWIKEGIASVERLVFILVDNAVKYTPPGGEVRVYLAEAEGMAVLDVSDNGMGIADSDLPHVFDRFWRADKMRCRQIEGTGLGLSIAHEIVERLGGTIHAESKVGCGSRFVVRMPILDPAIYLTLPGTIGCGITGFANDTGSI